MSTMSYGRLTWKEYRTQRSLWLSVLFLTVVAQYVFFVAGNLLRDAPFPLAAHIAIPFIGLSVYMLGCGATLFAIEHELGTFDFQRLLPVTAWRVYAAKMTVGVVSGIVLVAALMLVSHVFYVGWRPMVGAIDWLAGGITAVEVFGWAVLFSLLCRHPLRAAIGAIVTTTIVVCFVMPALTLPPNQDFDLFIFHRHSLPARGVVILALAIIDTWLANRWFHGKITSLQWPKWRRRVASDEMPPARSLPAYVGERTVGWGRLVGITWRQGRGVLFLFNLLFVLAFSFSRSAPGNPIGSVGLALFSSAVLFGVCAFTLDQWSYHFRFYAERGIDPRWLWLSRHAVWLTPVVLQSFALQTLCWNQRNSPSFNQFMMTSGYVLMAIGVYAISQLFAMFIRSTLVALVVSTFAAVMAGIWTAFTISADVPFWLGVLPIPVWLLISTWKFSTDWIEERTDRRHWVRVGLFLGIPTLVVLISCAAWRAYQIPLVDPGFSVTEYTRPLSVDEQGTLQIYQNAASQMAEGQFRADTVEASRNHRLAAQAWYESVKPVLPLLVAAHERTPVPVTLIKIPSRGNIPLSPSYLGDFNSSGFMRLLRMHAEVLAREEKLGEAWGYYEIHFELLRRTRMRAPLGILQYADYEERQLLDSIVRWSANKAQTKDLIAVALARLDGNEKQETFEHRQTKVRHVLWQAFLQGEEIHPNFYLMVDQQAKVLRRILTFMPWERIRLLRFLNVNTRSLLDPSFSQQLNRDGPYASIGRWQNTTPFGSQLSRHEADIMMPTFRRAARVLVALVDWRREHGELPDSLEDLVGPYFQSMPLNLMIMQPFFYSSTGIPIDLMVQHPSGDMEIVLPKDSPFLWSPQHPRTQFDLLPQEIDEETFAARKTKILETIRQGYIWLIPEPAEL